MGVNIRLNHTGVWHVGAAIWKEERMLSTKYKMCSLGMRHKYCFVKVISCLLLIDLAISFSVYVDVLSIWYNSLGFTNLVYHHCTKEVDKTIIYPYIFLS